MASSAVQCQRNVSASGRRQPEPPGARNCLAPASRKPIRKEPVSRRRGGPLGQFATVTEMVLLSPFAPEGPAAVQ